MVSIPQKGEKSKNNLEISSIANGVKMRFCGFLTNKGLQPADWMKCRKQSMWWIIALQEYLSRTGAEDFVQKQMDYLEALLRQLALDEDGNIHHIGCFLDWPHAGKPELMEGVRAIHIMAQKAAISLLEHFGRSADVARGQQGMTQLEQLMRQIIKHGPISKKELQERTGVSWGTVSGLITQLVEDRFVVPSPDDRCYRNFRQRRGT